jgi:type II secretory pathway pseudopilin PulG
MMKRNSGFTVLELIFAGVLFGIASIFFFIQKQAIETSNQDNIEKTAINSMYYGLEEVFYPTNGYYPQKISTDNLKSVDPALFTDPSGIKLGDKGGAYTYTSTNCDSGKCKSYTLKATLSNEADYIKNSKNH